MKCPICSKNNKNITAVAVYGNAELLQELSKTKQALDVAMEALEIFTRIPNSIAEIAKQKLDQIKQITETKDNK